MKVRYYEVREEFMESYKKWRKWRDGDGTIELNDVDCWHLSKMLKIDYPRVVRLCLYKISNQGTIATIGKCRYGKTDKIFEWILKLRKAKPIEYYEKLFTEQGK